jgi:xylulokinase
MGVDIGTSGIKVGLLNLATLRLEHLVANELESSLELRSENLWLQAKHTIKEAVNLLGNKETVLGMGVAGQMHGAVLYDQQDQVIDPIITWKDRARCSPEILEAVQLIVTQRGYYGLGTEMASGYTGTILLWIKEHDPRLFGKIAKFSLIADFIRCQLLGANDHCTDPTNAFGTGLFNVRENTKWHTSLIAELGLELRIFPKIRKSTAPAGLLSKPLAEELGLGEIPIIYGGGDNQVGMVGSGLISANSPVLVNIGTAAQISKIIPTYQAIPGMDIRSFFEDQYALVGASLGGGGSYQWLREEIRRQQNRPVDYAELNQRAARVAPGADGLVFCTGPARKFPNRRQGFGGNVAHVSDIGHQARAVMEGVLMDLYDHYSILEEYDHNPFMIGAGKAMQESQIWPQIAADLFGKPIRVMKSENVALGAAILVAFGSGYLKELDAAVEMGPYEDVKPDSRHSDFDNQKFSNYYHSQIIE